MASQVQAAVTSGRGMFRQAGKIGVPIMALLGALSDAAEPLGPFSFILAVGLMALAIVATVLNQVVSRRKFDAAASDGTITAEDRADLARGSGWATVAAFSVIGSLFCWLLVGLQQVASEGERGVLASNIAPIARLQESLLGLQQDVSAIRDTTARTEGKVDSLSSDVRRASKAMESVAEAVVALGRSGGVIASPSTAPEYFHNALTFEQLGQPAAARAAYAKFAEFDLDAIDAFERYAQLVRVQDGRQAARELFDGLAGRLGSVAVPLVAAAQCEGAERSRRLEQLAIAHPSYPPLFHALALDHEERSLSGSFTITRFRRRADALERFVASGEQGGLTPYFIDHQVLAGRLESARTQLAALQPQLAMYGRPPQLTTYFQPEGLSGGGSWRANVQVMEMTTRLFYSLGTEGAWLDTGVSAAVNPLTGKPMANMSFRLDALQPSGLIRLKYEDAEGQEVGPFEVAWESGDSQLRKRAKQQCESLQFWLAVPEPDRQGRVEIDMSNLLRHCCALDAILYSINDRSLDQTFQVPSCAQPTEPCRFDSVASKLRIELPDSDTFESLFVQLRYFDGSTSAVREFKSPGWERRVAGAVKLTGFMLSGGAGVAGIGVALTPEVEPEPTQGPRAPSAGTSDALGQFKLEVPRAGSYLALLHVPREWRQAPGKPKGTIHSVWISQRIDVPATGRFERNFELPAGSISGSITERRGRPCRNHRVLLSSSGAVEMGTTHGAVYGEMDPDRDGRFEFPWIPDGTYTVFVVPVAPQMLILDPEEEFQRGQPFVESVEVRGGKAVTDLNLQLTASGVLHGTVRDAQGGMQGGAAVFLRAASGTPLSRRTPVRSIATGQFSCGALPPGEYLLSASIAGLATENAIRVEVKEGELVEVDLTVKPATRLIVEWERSKESPPDAAVLVRDASGLQVNGLQPAVPPVTESSSLLHSVGPLPPGKYEVVLTGTDGRESRHAVELTGQPEQRVRIQL